MTDNAEWDMYKADYKIPFNQGILAIIRLEGLRPRFFDMIALVCFTCKYIVLINSDLPFPGANVMPLLCTNSLIEHRFLTGSTVKRWAFTT